MVAFINLATYLYSKNVKINKTLEAISNKWQSIAKSEENGAT